MSGIYGHQLKHGTTLQDFLIKFSNRNLINALDPEHTFDVIMKFYPANLLDNGSTKDTGQQAIQNTQNTQNASANNEQKKSSSNSSPILTSRNKFSPGSHTFLKYLLEANLLLDSYSRLGTSNEQSSTSPIEVQLGYYVQSLTVPQIKMSDGGTADTMLGKFPLNGNYVGPDNNTLTMSILNTKLPLLERVFYPWMREVTMPFWSYETQPYTTATITVDMTKHSDIKYVFYGCRPSAIVSEQPTQEVDSTMTRDVTFIFDVMYVQSEMNTDRYVFEQRYF